MIGAARSVKRRSDPGRSQFLTRLDDHKGLRPGVVVGQGHVDDRFIAFGRHLLQPFGSPTCYGHDRLAGAQIADGHVFP